MGSRTSGRKARPTALRVIEGRKPRSTNEPQPKIVKIPPPPELVGAALDEWNRVAPELYDLGLLSNIDRATLVAYCTQHSLYMGALDAIMKEAAADKKRPAKKRTNSNGYLVRSATGSIYQNPAVGILNKAQQAMVRFAAEFGMTPASRSRIDVKKARTDDPTSEFFD